MVAQSSPSKSVKKAEKNQQARLDVKPVGHSQRLEGDPEELKREQWDTEAESTRSHPCEHDNDQPPAAGSIAHEEHLQHAPEFEREEFPHVMHEVHGATEVSTRVEGARVFMFDGGLPLDDSEEQESFSISGAGHSAEEQPGQEFGQDALESLSDMELLDAKREAEANIARYHRTIVENWRDGVASYEIDRCYSLLLNEPTLLTESGVLEPEVIQSCQSAAHAVLAWEDRISAVQDALARLAMTSAQPEPEPEPEPVPGRDSAIVTRADDTGACESLPIATLICVPGAGAAGAAAAAGISHRAHGPGLWSTKKLLEKHGPDVATTTPYHSWASDHGVLAVTLSSNSPDAIMSALTACNGPVLLAAHSEGGAALVEVAKRRTPDLSFLFVERGVRVCAVALLDSVHKGPLPGAEASKEGGVEQTLLNPAAACAFVTSSKALGDSKPKPWVKDGFMHGCPTRSAGTTQHLLVPHAAQEAVFEFFEQRLEALRTEENQVR